MSHPNTVDLFGTEPRHKPQTENVSTFKPTQVELIDGTIVSSNSEGWRAECEAMTVLAWDAEKRQNYFESVERHRGSEELANLKRMMSQVLPRYVLEMPDRDARRAYLTGYERRVSSEARERLEQAVKDLHARRQAKRIPRNDALKITVQWIDEAFRAGARPEDGKHEGLVREIAGLMVEISPGLDVDRLMSGHLSEKDWPLLSTAVAKLKDADVTHLLR